MKRTFILAALIAGCTPNGVAAPVAPSPAPNNPGAFQEPPPRPTIRSWVVLGKAPTIDLAQTHMITTTEPFGQIMVKATGGEPEIEQIEVEYQDHQTRVIPVARRFAAGEGQVIELREKRAISKIIVHTDPDTQGEYVLYGG